MAAPEWYAGFLLARTPPVRSEASENADFSGLRYAQCWEDADILLEALDIRPGQTCLSIASAGDNTLAMVACAPARVIALDMSQAQLAALELRVAAYRELSQPELLVLMGSSPGRGREQLYRRCRSQLSESARSFWDGQSESIRRGIGGAGKFERYFAAFRTRILPLVHSRSRAEKLLAGGTKEMRSAFYSNEWNTWRWRLLFRIFFSRFIMGRFGRDPSFFKYVEGSIADRILERTHYALTELNPAENPYAQWILIGRHTSALPYALRPEHFDSIRDHLDRLEWHNRSIEDFLEMEKGAPIHCFNLSDIFEYMSPENYERLLGRIARAGTSGGRLAYWNMLAERHRPDSMRGMLRPLADLASNLHARDKAFFYSTFVVEEII
jgi:S-adenosylmethionine-diacylglycerol 3-amino-3-carboxypropyl transferase